MRSTATNRTRGKNKGGALAELAKPLFFAEESVSEDTDEHHITCLVPKALNYIIYQYFEYY